MNTVELKEMVGGGLQEQFSKSFEKVIENLLNPNTPYKNNREINIKLKFTQNEARNDVKCAVQVVEKLAPQAPMETAFAIGKNLRDGKLYAEEYGKQLKGQASIDDLDSQGVVSVDINTGENIDEKSRGTVINFRKAAAQ